MSFQTASTPIKPELDDTVTVSDLRQRLSHAESELKAYRAENDRLVKEMELLLRTLRSLGHEPGFSLGAKVLGWTARAFSAIKRRTKAGMESLLQGIHHATRASGARAKR
jgi:hypothetical protein